MVTVSTSLLCSDCWTLSLCPVGSALWVCVPAMACARGSVGNHYSQLPRDYDHGVSGGV